MGGQKDEVLEFKAELPFFEAPLRMAKNALSHRQLLKHFVARDLKIRYHNSIIGYGWSVLEPLALTVTFYVLFSIISEDQDPFRPLTILLGILSWSLFAKILSSGTTSLQRNSSLIQRVYFPRELFIFSKVGFQIVQLVLSLLVIIPLLIHYQLQPTSSLLLLPCAIGLISMFGMGLGFFTSILQTKARDIEHIVAISLRISFYLSPVFYPLEMITGGRVPEQYIGYYLIINPMATFITMVRSAFTGAPLNIPQENILITVALTMVIFWSGSIFFMRRERRAVKFL